MYYTMIDVIWCTEQCVFLRIKIFDSTCSCVESFISETLKHLTKCWVGGSGPTCLLNEYLFKYVQFQVFTYTKSVHTFK